MAQAEEFAGYDYNQLIQYHTPVWLRGGKYFVQYKGKEYQHDTADYTEEQLKKLDGVAIKSDPQPVAKPK